MESLRDLTRARWRRPSHDGDTGGYCVEIVTVSRHVTICDFKDLDRPAFTFTRNAVTAFVRATASSESGTRR
ncbi:DUF397 domain-containing protein [Streptomyces inhibens]|uniref:DUF397 domain-containing protein n=2 Tax=Streptomyces inhibens TaxID=2293571 RepID=A0A371PVD0_STRIH|nr:DUF397 domain-containing protein [Streptomyces inhibens]